MVVRMVCLSGLSTLIQNGTIRKTAYGLFMYVALFVGSLLLIALAVNLDSYRLRIMLNYMNFHINDSAFYTYIIGTLLFTGTIAALMIYVNFPYHNFGDNVASDTDKMKLLARVEVITLIMWAAMTLVVIIM
jgi:hypothetical protein